MKISLTESVHGTFTCVIWNVFIVSSLSWPALRAKFSGKLFGHAHDLDGTCGND